MSDKIEPSPSEPVTLGEIVAILIRVLALNFALHLTNYLLWEVALGRAFSVGRFQSHSLAWIPWLVFSVSFLGVYWLWQLAPFFARLITRGRNAALPNFAFDLLDLYSFAFVLIGLSCIAESIGPSFTWLHYAITQSSSTAALTPDQKSNFYTLFKYLVKLIIGLALTFQARHLAIKLLKRQGEIAAT
ncbi:MAG: hypothetical protein ABJF10_11155 [Chthoniobacter sp.]|uniref:hypothetical protein n=1 Tax=Chthoniobacter sp. TaxID=2510640 RepID=UPI0032A87DA3